MAAAPRSQFVLVKTGGEKLLDGCKFAVGNRLKMGKYVEDVDTVPEIMGRVPDFSTEAKPESRRRLLRGAVGAAFPWFILI
jgi:hypothetical protein